MDIAAEMSDTLLCVTFRSRVAQKLLAWLPTVRGFSMVGSWLFRFLPVAPFVDVWVRGKPFRLDLRYRSQLAIIKTWPPEPAEIGFVLEHLQPGDVFFDLGSNWGLYTAVAATIVGEDGLVVAVELNPEPFARLLRLVHTSALTNVLAFNVALSDVSGDRAGIVKPWYRNDTASFLSKATSDQTDAITTRTLDKLWKQVGSPQVRMVKLDVEGFEPVVIRGGISFLTNGVTDFALVEVSDWAETRTGVHYSEIYTELARCGFEQVYIFQDGGLVRVRTDENASLPVNRNVLFSKRVIA
jgi:FkbM family methyltransferase